MSGAGDVDQHRDFPGRSLLINLLRAAHLAGVIGLGAAMLGSHPAGGTEIFVGVLIAAGVAIALLDRWANPGYFRQVNGLSVLLKVALLAGVGALAGFKAWLFWAVVMGSVLIVHAPRVLRHRKLF